ncbi:Rad60-SLD-2 domain-containing protein [Mycena indigotica]|uniref:Rad60-SLD-2 domain-containing protein n=1 Tax=Mycena indigotica TaxID=2126181 RepID=A0A8H6SM07_9AGAR|nr:Rad60-SLD-2 domain-containing protein [Mycena indigotica]KAF7301106.1 Rad60-SLD-2 domain-containing protein [Mycena indigotica]
MQQLPTPAPSVTGLLLASNAHLGVSPYPPSGSPSAATSVTRVDVDSDDDPTDVVEQQQPQPESLQPQTTLMFLLASGSRCTRSYELHTTIQTVKSTLWDSWPSDWPERPPLSACLRILHLGRVLQDEEPLSKLGFPSGPETAPSPTIVHLAISPSPSRQSPNNGDEVGGCQCIIC